MQKTIKSTALLAILACILWSTAFVGIKIGLQYMTPLQFAGIRFFFAGLLIIPVSGNFKSYIQLFVKHFWFMLLVAFLQTVLMYSLFYTGLNMVPGAVAAMVIGSGPLFAAIVAHFTMSNDRMNLRSTFSILLGLTGIVIINYGRQVKGIAGASEIIGVLILIVNNMVSGIYNVVVMKSKRKIPPLVLCSVSLWLGGLVLFLVSIPIEGIKATLFPTEFYLSLSWLSFLSAVAMSIWFTLLKRPGVKISNLNTWKFIVPVFGAILSWIFLSGESPDAYALVGMFVVGAAMLVMNNEAIKIWLRRKE